MPVATITPITAESMLAVFQQQFPGGVEELNTYMSLMGTYLQVKVAEANQRIANAEAEKARGQANIIIQSAAEQMSAAQDAFDALAAKIAQAS